MVKITRHSKERGSLVIELVVALGIVSAVLLPLAYGQWFEMNALRKTYERSVAAEIVDGELEVLAAGEWRHFPPGQHRYSVTARAATNLPLGQFTLTRQGPSIRLQWEPNEGRHGRAVVREVEVAP